MAGVTLVAFYRSKPKALGFLLEACQALLVRHLGQFYLPYEVGQIHATIVGLEGYRVDGKIRPTRLVPLLNSDAEIVLDHALAYLRDTPLLPMRIRMGGFQRNVEYGFKSRGELPYDRSFSIQDGTATLIGWPVVADSYPSTLFQLRKGLERFGILHKYHESGVPDNDLYFVLGQLHGDTVPSDAIQAATHAVRQSLSGNPLTIGLSADDLYVVKYALPTLTPATSQSWQVMSTPLDRESLLALYDEKS